MRNKGIRLTVVMAIALVLLVAISFLFAGENGESDRRQQDGEALLDAVLDRKGVTQITEVIAWLAEQEQIKGEENLPEALTVWVRRSGGQSFHCFPLCWNIGKDPVGIAYEEAMRLEMRPCSVCCE